VEPTTPCATKKYEKKYPFTKQTISSKRILVGRGYRGNLSGSMNSTRDSQLSTSCGGGSTTKFTMAGADLTIQLPAFHGERSKDSKKYLFICENIWEDKQIMDEGAKVVQLAIFRTMFNTGKCLKTMNKSNSSWKWLMSFMRST
jgi:hypothetical protein